MSIKKRFSDELRELADRMDNNDNYIIQYIHDHFIRPLQECRIYTKNEVAEKLEVSASYVSKLTKSGALKTTIDGRITHYHLREYLTNSPNHSP
jgi:hypothetical protein